MEVYLSELAEARLKKLTDYLLEHWSHKVKKDFLSKLTKKIQQIAMQPESCEKSKEFKE